MSEVTATLGMSFKAVDLYEANLDADSVEGLDFPLCLYILPQTQRNTQSSPNSIERTVSCMLFILYRIGQDTADKEKASLADTVQMANHMADRLVSHLSKHSVSINEGVKDWRVDEVYAEFDANLHGVKVEFDWKILDGKPCY